MTTVEKYALVFGMTSANRPQSRQPSDRLYREILDQIAWGENNGFDDVRPTITRNGCLRLDFSRLPRISAIANNCGRAAFSRSSTQTPRSA